MVLWNPNECGKRLGTSSGVDFIILDQCGGLSIFSSLSHSKSALTNWRIGSRCHASHPLSNWMQIYSTICTECNCKMPEMPERFHCHLGHPLFNIEPLVAFTEVRAWGSQQKGNFDQLLFGHGESNPELPPAQVAWDAYWIVSPWVGWEVLNALGRPELSKNSIMKFGRGESNPAS
jgi:hypothetical protein